MKLIREDDLLALLTKHYFDNDKGDFSLLIYNLCKEVRCIPTAYDADSVVEQLEEELKLSQKEKCRCQKENMFQFFEAKGYERGVTNAIEILKGGGVDENRD